MIISRSIHGAADIIISSFFFLWLSNISLYVCVTHTYNGIHIYIYTHIYIYIYTYSGIYTFCIYIHTYTHIYIHTQWNIYIVHTYHIFIHSSVDGCLGCFYVLAIINSAVVNIVVHVSF